MSKQSNNINSSYYGSLCYNEQSWANSVKPSSLAYVFTKPYIGENDDMGKQALSDFITTLTELEMLPKIIVFWNSAVKLCIKDSPILASLEQLEKMGTKILVASHAIASQNLQSSLRVGNLGGYYDLIHALNAVHKVITF